MRVHAKKKPYDDINITPMLDLAYVLLVIFIIMTTAAVQGIKVNVPKASSAVSLAKPTTKAIAIDSSGSIYLDAMPVTIDELESQLRSWPIRADAGRPRVRWRPWLRSPSAARTPARAG